MNMTYSDNDPVWDQGLERDHDDTELNPVRRNERRKETRGEVVEIRIEKERRERKREWIGLLGERDTASPD